MTDEREAKNRIKNAYFYFGSNHNYIYKFSEIFT